MVVITSCGWRYLQALPLGILHTRAVLCHHWGWEYSREQGITLIILPCIECDVRFDWTRFQICKAINQARVECFTAHWTIGFQTNNTPWTRVARLREPEGHLRRAEPRFYLLSGKKRSRVFPSASAALSSVGGHCLLPGWSCYNISRWRVLTHSQWDKKMFYFSSNYICSLFQNTHSALCALLWSLNSSFASLL